MMIKYIVLLFAVIDLSSSDEGCDESATNVYVSKTFKSCAKVAKAVKVGPKYTCPNIEMAFKYLLNHAISMNHTCIRLRDDQVINHLNQLNNVNHLTIRKDINVIGLVNITCGPESGFALYDSSNISLYGLSFHQCGVQNFVEQNGYYSTALNISTAFFMYQIEGVNFTDVSFISTNGYAVVLIGGSGSMLFKRVNVSNGVLVPNIYNGKPIEGYSSGGGIYLEYRHSDLTKYSSFSDVKFEFCQFFNNTADQYNAAANAKGGETSHIPFGRGGGLTLMFLGKARYINILIRNCTFSHNSAAWGGGVYIRFMEKAIMNRILLDGVTFDYNNANMSGGGLITSSTQKLHRNKLNLINSVFKQNIVHNGEGGGISLSYVKSHPTYEEDGVLDNCQFAGNTAPLGSDVHLQNVHVKFINLYLHGSKIKPFVPKPDNRDQAGGLYSFQSRLVIFGSSNVSHYTISGFILDSSCLQLNGKLDFISNEGYNGGALSLLGRSYITLNQTAILNFRNNSANKNGGAIYVSIPNAVSFPKNIDFQMYPCFFIFKQGISNFYGRVTFENNRCNNSGSAIFTSTLQNCYFVNTSAKYVIREWRNFIFLDKQIIATNAVNIKIIPENWKVWPGKVFSPHIQLMDEQNNTVDEAIDIDIHTQNKNVDIESLNRRFLVKNNTITLKLLVHRRLENQSYEIKFVINIYLARDDSIKTKGNSKLVPCLLGFTFYNDRCVCNIQRNKVRGIAACYEDKSYIFFHRWALPNQTALATDNETTQVCPPNYCRRDCPGSVNELACLYEPNNQCRTGRNQKSLLCSRCENEKSVSFGSETCKDCTGKNKWNFLWIIPVLIIVLFVFVAVILTLNIDIYRYYLNGFFYYYQVVKLLLPSNFKSKEVESLIAIINLSGLRGVLGHVCLWNGLNDLQKEFFNYLIPVLMILILIILSVFFSRRQILKTNCIRAFIAISVWAYSDLTRLTFNLLKPVTINGKTYVHIYAHARYGHSEHLPYLIIACLFLIVIILFPFMLMLSSRLSGLHFRHYHNPLARWHLVFDSFKYCFKPDRQFFVSYYFLCRILLLAITTFADQTPEENIALALLCLVVCMIFQVCLPYEEKEEGDMFWTNMFDVMVLANLTAISILRLAVTSVRKDPEKHYFMLAITVLMYIPLSLVLLRILYLHLPRIWELIKKQLHKNRRGKQTCARACACIFTYINP